MKQKKDVAAFASDEATACQGKIKELEVAFAKATAYRRESQEHLEGWKRAKADFVNYKKRQEEISAEFRKFACEGIIEDFLPILDNMELALAHVPEDQRDAEWIKGIVHIKRMLKDTLKANRVEEITVNIGDEFDPEIHEVVAKPVAHNPEPITDETEDEMGNIIKKVIRKGYRLNGKIIRVARILV